MSVLPFTRSAAAMTSEQDFNRRRRARNWAMLIVLLALSALFFAITIVKMTKA